MTEAQVPPGTSSRERVYLIDASIYIFRYYFSLPDNWFSDNGYPTAAVYGYTHWLIRLLKQLRPTKIAACFDESLTTCFRNDIYPAYKSSRALPDEALAFQLLACRNMTELLGVPTYFCERHEADDLIGTLARKNRRAGRGVTILSRDKDLSQLLVEDRDLLWDFPEGPQLDSAAVFKKYAIYPHQFADYLALVGDPGDDIPGVPGLGPKTAARLLAHFDSWQQLNGQLDTVATLEIRGARRIQQLLLEYREQISMARRLTTIIDTAPLGRRMAIHRKPMAIDRVFKFGTQLGFSQGFYTTLKKLSSTLEDT